MSTRTIRLGTRKSKLALWQSHFVADALRQRFPAQQIELVEITTQGDTIVDRALPAIGGKGLFTAELEAGLTAHTLDIAVHSLKDLPTESPPQLCIGAILERTTFRDVLITRNNCSLYDLPHGAIIGTSSPRRERQLLRLRPDVVCKDIRGNVDTRIRKVREGLYDATLLAEAGLARLSLLGEVSHFLSAEEMIAAPGQGALAVQCRADDEELLSLLKAIDHAPTRFAVGVERGFLAALGAGCSTPVAALCEVQSVEGATYHYRFRARVLSPSSNKLIETDERGQYHVSSVDLDRSAAALGARYAERSGAGVLLRE